MRDRNGYELNTGSIIAALLYGEGDFVKTLTAAFNFGWDADCNAATAGTIVGVMKGYRWMLAQGWQIVDRYKNTTRENMPNDETITSFADRLVDLAERVILEQGGRRPTKDGRIVYQIQVQEPRAFNAWRAPTANGGPEREARRGDPAPSALHQRSRGPGRVLRHLPGPGALAPAGASAAMVGRPGGPERLRKCRAGHLPPLAHAAGRRVAKEGPRRRSPEAAGPERIVVAALPPRSNSLTPAR